ISARHGSRRPRVQAPRRRPSPSRPQAGRSRTRSARKHPRAWAPVRGRPRLHPTRMSTAAHPVVPEGAPRGALVARLISASPGTVGVGAKVAFLSASNGVAIWAIYVLITRHHRVAGALLAAAA